MELLSRLFGWDSVQLDYNAPVEPQKPSVAPSVSDKPKDIPKASEPASTPSNREKLYATAKSFIGRDASPRDLAPDSLGCAESLNCVFETAFGKPILKNVVGTAALLVQLKKDPRFVEVKKPEAGDIVMNASGTSTKGARTGHCGVWGYEAVMSNNSATGKWSTHYTLASWKTYFETKLGFPTRYFRVK